MTANASTTAGLPTAPVGVLAAPLSAEQMREQVNAIQRLMDAVMREGEHYGCIPGARKPSLWKPGAEKLCVAFHIEPAFVVEDLSTAGCYRYRVKCIGTHQVSGVKLGEGMGACSSLEQKFQWRGASDTEFANTQPKRRRLRYRFERDAIRPIEVKQVRLEHTDLENTILKIACKRAHVAMTLNVTAASDIFTQDIEDYPERVQEDEDPTVSVVRSKVEQPRQKSKKADEARKQTASGLNAAPASTEVSRAEDAGTLSEGQQRILRLRMAEAALSDDSLMERFGAKLQDLPAARFSEIAAWVREAAEARR